MAMSTATKVGLWIRKIQVLKVAVVDVATKRYKHLDMAYVLIF
jgi:hypothetical protein